MPDEEQQNPTSYSPSEHQAKPSASESPYRSAPLPSSNLPGGIPYIIGNEMAERFSFYGMKCILVVFMTEYLRNSNGQYDTMSDEDAKVYYHLFTGAAYIFPILGALLSDVFLGKYRTILFISLAYCLGHLVLAIDDTRLGLAMGLSIIAVGAGGIKPCVSAHVGDQFGAQNQHHLSKVFAWFYFSINLGAFVSTILTPWYLEYLGPYVAFGVPGVLMLSATIFFWSGRHKFIHVPPTGIGFLKEAFSGRGLKAIANLLVLYLFLAMFWALFDQTGSSWVLQSKELNRNILGIEILPSQIQAVNPVLILLGIPLFTYVIYPLIDRVFPLTPLRKIAIGFFLTAASFAICALLETVIAQGGKPFFGWQVLAYVVLTSAEIMVSITCLEFSYTQAPKKLKSFIMGLFFGSVAMGNLLASAVNMLIQNEDGTSKLTNTAYFWLFALAMLVTAVAFVPAAMFYRGQTYIQDESN